MLLLKVANSLRLSIWSKELKWQCLFHVDDESVIIMHSKLRIFLHRWANGEKNQNAGFFFISILTYVVKPGSCCCCHLALGHN